MALLLTGVVAGGAIVAIPIAAVQQRHPASSVRWSAWSRPNRRRHSLRWRSGDPTRRARHDGAASRTGSADHHQQPASGAERIDSRDEIECESARVHSPSVEPRNDCQLGKEEVDGPASGGADRGGGSGSARLKGYDVSRSIPNFTFPSGNTAYISSRPPIASTKFSSVLR
jgi:hypothetical protein